MGCSVDGCTEMRVHGHGLCTRHYKLWLRNGDPTRSLRSYHKDKTPEERFWLYANRAERGCWEWTGTRSNGYGFMWIAAGKPRVLAHRFSYELHHGPVPAGFNVCHTCDNPWCVNPAHLFAGTDKDNMRDMIAKGRDHHPPLQGEANGSAKLNAIQVRKIRQLKMTARQLADRFGVSKQLIDAIRQRRLWAHIE